MAALTTYLANKLVDHSNGVASYTMPAVYIALIVATAGNNAASPRSTAVTLNQTTVPATPNGHMYRCTTAGTTGSGEPTWPTSSGGTVTDGTAVWTEMTPDFQAATNLTEATYTGYARKALSGLMGAASAGSATNSSAIAYAADTSGNNFVAAWVSYDAATAGNALKFAILTAPLAVSAGVTPQFSTSNLTTSLS